MIKALALLRVSTTNQSVERQKKELEEFTTSKGFKPDEVYYLYKEGASAFKIDDDYLELKNKMYQFLLSNPSCKTVFAWHVNRLGRDEQQLHEIRNFLVKNGIQLFIQEPTLYLLNPDGSENGGMALAFSMFATMARLQIQELQAKTRDARFMNAKKNKFQGGKDVKVGYAINEDRYIVVDTNNEGYKLVQLIFNEYATGKYSFNTLYKELRDRGYKKPSGKPIDALFIKKILSDESYIGGCSKEVITERRYTPIIAKEVWNKCEEIRNKNRCGEIVKANKNNFLGIKIVKCNCCGSNAVGNKEHYRCYKAWDRTRDQYYCENRTNLKIEIMDGLLWRIASTKHMDYLNQVKETDKNVFEKDIMVIKEKITEKKKQMEDLPNKKMRIQLGFENGIYSIEEYKKKLSSIDNDAKIILDEILALETKMKKLNSLINGETDVDKEIERMLDVMFGVMDEKDKKEQKSIVDKYIDSATYCNEKNYQLITIVDKDGNDWVFRYYPNRKKGKKIMIMIDNEEKEFN